MACRKVGFEEFKSLIKFHLEKYLDGHKAEIVIEEHNHNGEFYTSISVNYPRGHSPLYDLNNAYSMYLSKEEDSDKLIAGLSEALYQHICSDFALDDTEFSVSFDDFDKIKERIVVRLINKENNKELLNIVPYVTFLDMAVVFYYYLTPEECKENIPDYNEKGAYATIIKRKYFEKWEIPIKDLYLLAKKNTLRLLSPTLCKLDDYLGDLSDDEEFLAYVKENWPELFDMAAVPESPMLYFTNKFYVHGASSIVLDGILGYICRSLNIKGVILIPSSVHEWLFIPFDGDNEEITAMTLEHFSVMIKEVNSTMSKEEILSTHAYYYDAVDGKFCW